MVKTEKKAILLWSNSDAEMNILCEICYENFIRIRRIIESRHKLMFDNVYVDGIFVVTLTR